MYTPKPQQGMTFISTLVLLVVAGFFVLLLLKLGPIYLENYTIKTVVKSVVDDPLLAGRPLAEIRTQLDNRLYVNEVRRLKPRDFNFTREGESLKLTIKYTVQEHILFNVDALISFEESGVFRTPMP